MLIALAMAAAIEGSAPSADRQGRATVRCHVTAAGRLTQCVALSESPVGANVGAFAVKLAGAYRVQPSDRRIRAGTITIPMRFKLP
ncbi:TonB family protein [Phenylobacterium aquaticum]|uniref:TonB family protein n=1 Tax=Phenylobacterium aquaticum TaxID=1763816 RepID=UPI0026F23C09|nr:TonB family protein [Phenylobacterium aquaticum]